VLRTEDGGILWQQCAVPPGAEHMDFRGIQAFDAKTAIVMSSGKGELSRLYKTTDGCHSWKSILKNSDKDGFWDAFQFSDKEMGWILGDPVRGEFQLWETNSGGKDWVREGKSDALKADSKSMGAFASSNSALNLGGPKAPFVMFGSGGISGAFLFAVDDVTVCIDDCDTAPKHHWRRVVTPIVGGSESSGIFSVLMRDASAGVIVGGDYLKPEDATRTAAYTEDGGKTWHAGETLPHGYRSSVAYDAASKTWITVGPNGTDISTDDGHNWRALQPDPALKENADADRKWNAISLPFVVGPHGRIGKLNGRALAP